MKDLESGDKLYSVTFTPDAIDPVTGTVTVAGVADTSCDGTCAYTYNSANKSITVANDNKFLIEYNANRGCLTFQTSTMPYALILQPDTSSDESDITSDLSLGNNALDGNSEGIPYVFVAPVSGEYVFSYAEGETNGYPMMETPTGAENISFPYTVTLDAGETFTFVMATDDMADDVIDIVITKTA